MNEKEYLRIGERIWNLIRLFNIREAGISRSDDTLPLRFFKEPLPMFPKGESSIVLPREKFDQMLDEYYRLRGWNADGVPVSQKLKELDISSEGSFLL